MTRNFLRAKLPEHKITILFNSNALNGNSRNTNTKLTSLKLHKAKSENRHKLKLTTPKNNKSTPKSGKPQHNRKTTEDQTRRWGRSAAQRASPTNNKRSKGRGQAAKQEQRSSGQAPQTQQGNGASREHKKRKEHPGRAPAAAHPPSKGRGVSKQAAR